MKENIRICGKTSGFNENNSNDLKIQIFNFIYERPGSVLQPVLLVFIERLLLRNSQEFGILPFIVSHFALPTIRISNSN